MKGLKQRFVPVILEATVSAPAKLRSNGTLQLSQCLWAFVSALCSALPLLTASHIFTTVVMWFIIKELKQTQNSSNAIEYICGSQTNIFFY